MSGKRRRFSGEQKAKIGLEALRGERTLQEIASRHQVHPNRIGTWKRQAIEGLIGNPADIAIVAMAPLSPRAGTRAAWAKSKRSGIGSSPARFGATLNA